MIRSALRWAAVPVTALLVIFNLRRLVFTITALTRKDCRIPHSAFRIHHSVLILVPCRDEAATLPGLIECLARLEYPPERMIVTLVDDGSRDETGALIEQAAASRANWRAIHLGSSRGKAQALNEALVRIEFGDVIVVYDADHRPDRDSLKRLAAAFDDPLVAGASGRTIPLNPIASLPAYYATIESLVHQMITMRAKDRLDLAPALLGSNCAYRRSALAEAGGFRPGALLEDSDLTLAFARLGYRLRFVPGAISRHRVPESIDGYFKQHVRWARGFNDVARNHAVSALTDRRLPLRLRVELVLFSLGYLDRLALLVAIGMKAMEWASARAGGRLLGSVLKISLLMPLAQIVAVFIGERASRGMWLRLPAIPFLFSLDVLVALRAAIDSVLNRPRVWTKTKRVGNYSAQRHCEHLPSTPLRTSFAKQSPGGQEIASSQTTLLLRNLRLVELRQVFRQS